MTACESWSMRGGLQTPWYRLFDRLRRRVNRTLVNFLTRHLHDSDIQSTARTRTLEAGSGPGFATSLLTQRPDITLAVCLDIDVNALREARRRDPELPVVVGDINRMPFADGVFDVVFNSSTVEHLDEPLAAVREMHRVCHPAGRVFVGVPYLWGPLGFQPLIAATAVGVWIGRVFARRSLDRLLVAAGLTPICHLRYFGNFFLGAVCTPSGSQQGRPWDARPPC